MVLAVVLGLGGALLALRLRPNAGIDTFVGRSSAAYRETQRYYRNFGEEPVQVLVTGSLQQLLLSSDIERLLGLEGCLSGKLPPEALLHEGGDSGPCGQLVKARSVRVVLGPGTFLNEAAIALDAQLAERKAQAEAQAKQARRVVTQAALARGHSAAEATSLGEQARKATLTGYAAEVTAFAVKYGINSEPSLEDPNFISTVVFSKSERAGTPKQRFAYLFPSRNAALVSIRLKAGLSAPQRAQAISSIRRAVAMPQWHLQHGESYLVTGEPVLVSDLTNSIAHSAELLLIAVALVMAAMLGLIFAGTPKLLPLAVALLATALTFGGLSLFGSSLTLAQVAVLPVLVGLAVDYAIQLQSRVGEALAQDGADIEAAIRRAATLGGPSIAAAATAGAGALLVLAFSPVPTVRGFGLLLVGGILVAFFCALTVGSAGMVLAERARSGARWSGRSPARARALTGALADSWRGASDLLKSSPLTRSAPRIALGGAVTNPGRMLAAGCVLAVLGWGLSTQTDVQTDITKLVPQNLASLKDLRALEQQAGVGGELDLMISGKNITRPSVIEWMSSYQSAMLRRYGFTAKKGCGSARICPAFSLPDLLEGGQGGETPAAKLTQKQVGALLSSIRPYFSQDVITANRRVATLAFGIRLMSLQEQQEIIVGMRDHLHPPPGVKAQLVGLAVLAAQADSQVSSVWRRTVMLLAGLALAALILLVAFRFDLRRALLPMIPVVLATGWSSLVLFLVRVPLNPLSVTLSAMVVAVSTEFSVLISERHRQERLAGHDAVEALRVSLSRTGSAVSASALTAIAGFAVLILSNVRMLRDFGLVTVVDLSVSLIGVLLVLPPTLLLAEQGPSAQGSARRLAGRIAALMPRGGPLARRREDRAHHEPI